MPKSELLALFSPAHGAPPVSRKTATPEVERTRRQTALAKPNDGWTRGSPGRQVLPQVQSPANMKLWRATKLPAKTALAAALSFFAYRALRLPHGYWAPISAIIVMQSNLGRSLSESLNRVIGTAIGAVIGALFTRLLGVNGIALFVAVGVTALVCMLLRLATSMRLACVTAAIVLLISEGSAWQSGLNRFIDVVLGVIMALVANRQLLTASYPHTARTNSAQPRRQSFL